MTFGDYRGKYLTSPPRKVTFNPDSLVPSLYSTNLYSSSVSVRQLVPRGTSERGARFPFWLEVGKFRRCLEWNQHPAKALPTKNSSAGHAVTYLFPSAHNVALSYKAIHYLFWSPKTIELQLPSNCNRSRVSTPFKALFYRCYIFQSPVTTNLVPRN